MRKSIVKREEILKDYKEGMKQVDICKKHRIGYSTLKVILNLPYKRYFRVPYDREAVIRDYKSGMPVKKILKKHNIKSYKNIYGLFNRYKVKREKEDKSLYNHEWKFNSYEPACFLPECWDAKPHKHNYRIASV